MPSIDPSIIQQILAPAAMVPACGLLLLSSTARMNTVLGRIRTFHAERLDVWRSDAQAGTRADSVRALRLEGLEHQTHKLLSRAALLRLTMLQLFGAVSCNLLSVIGLAMLYLLEEPPLIYNAAVLIFILGVLLILGAMVTSVLEVQRILETVQYEHRRVEGLCAQSSVPATLDTAPRTRESPKGTGL